MSHLAPLPLLRSLATGTLVVLVMGAISVALLALLSMTAGAPEEAIEELIVLLLYGLLAAHWAWVRRLRDDAHLLIPGVTIVATGFLAATGEAVSGMVVALIGALLLIAERVRRSRRA